MDSLQMMEHLLVERCERLQHPNYTSLGLSIFILVGILISYLPQHWRILSLGTSAGISPYFILLGTTSGTSAFANILTSPTSQADVKCCKHISAFECTAGLLGIAQVGVQWLCFTLILVLFLVFFPRPSLPNVNEISTIATKYTWRTALTVAGICLLHGFVVTAVSGWILLARPHHLQNWSNALGIMATILAAIQYIPQIWTTWNLGQVGSLSILMMFMQVPGSFLWCWSLYLRLGVAGWSTWGVFLVTGTLQACLFFMALGFEWRDRQEARPSQSDNPHATCIVGRFTAQNSRPEDDEGGTVVEDEETPLLTGSQRSKKSSKKLRKSPRRKSTGQSSRPQTPVR